MQRKWVKPNKINDSIVGDLIKNPRMTGISEVMLKILVNRGINTVDEIESFLFSGLKDLIDTRLMKDAEKAVDIINESISNNEHIVIYGDYDCDGIGSIVVMKSLLGKLGATVNFYTNNRFLHGYGMCKEGIDEIMNMYPDTKLIITVDNGIVAFEGVEYAKEIGLKIIVTDHHEPKDFLPSADAVVNPKRHDCTYPFKDLCGAGIAFKLMLLLYWKLGKKLQEVYDMLDVVSLSTVGDVVSLRSENRIMVREGLKYIEAEKKPIFRIFREVTGTSEINSHFTLGFLYVPMLNAIGRIKGDPRLAIEMFFHEDEESILNDLNYLKELNEERKAMTEEQLEIAENQVLAKGNKEAYIVYDEGFHEGIVGLIAGRLKEKYNRPVVALTKNEGLLKGSARSIDNFHLKESFDKLSYLLCNYGGHKKAAGLSIEEAKLDEFEKELINLCKETLTKDDFIKKYQIDCFINSKTVSLDIIDDLRQLEPFGEGFPKPILALDNFKVEKVFTMGSEKQHIKLEGDNMSVIMWRGAEIYKERGEPQNIRVLGYPVVNVYKNTVSLQFIVDGDNFCDMSILKQ